MQSSFDCSTFAAGKLLAIHIFAVEKVCMPHFLALWFAAL